MYKFWEMGMQELIRIEERPPFCWKGLVVIVLGIAQLAISAFLVATSGGILSSLGVAFVSEGINDICTGAIAIYNGDQNFVKSWAAGKAANMAISVATFGFNQIRTLKVTGEGLSKLKETFSAAKNKITQGATLLATEIKEIPAKISVATVKSACKEVKCSWYRETTIANAREIHRLHENYGEDG